jgi:hypothetical protein
LLIKLDPIRPGAPAGVLDKRQLASYRGVSFQLAGFSGKASWKLAPRENPHLLVPLALDHA